MKHFSEETRRRMSESAKQRCTPDWRKRKSDSIAYPISVPQAKRLYESGMTQDEVAKEIGVSRKVISRVMRQNGISARKAAKRDQWGEKNHMWKGDEAGIGKLHKRLDRRFGKPKKCEVCGTDDPDKTYDWANLTGNYTDLHDFKRMCRSCHHRFDGKIENIRGGERV